MDDDINEENIYDTVEIEDMEFDKRTKTFYYPCPCGDRFALTLKKMMNNYKIAECPSCSLQIRVVFDLNYLNKNFSEYIR